jgi:hypothetical protein
MEFYKFIWFFDNSIVELSDIFNITDNSKYFDFIVYSPVEQNEIQLSGTLSKNPEFSIKMGNVSKTIGTATAVGGAAKIVSSLKGASPLIKVITFGFGAFAVVSALTIVNRLTGNNAGELAHHKRVITSSNNITESKGPSILSPLEKESSWWEIYLPEWMSKDIDDRIQLVNCDNNIGEASILFTQYNLMGYQIYLTYCLMLFFSLFVLFLFWVKRNKIYLNENYPKTLGKVSNIKYLDLIISMNILGIILMFLSIGQLLYFIYSHIIPIHWGEIIDNIKK